MALVPLELKFRTLDAGGDVDATPDLSQFHHFWQKPRLLLLIHGFNNPVPDATKGYDAFLELQQQLAGVPQGGVFAPDLDVVEVFWKGDAWGILSPLYYMEAIPSAVETAGALAQVLGLLATERGETIEVNVVAHSLGTRLALELIKHVAVDARIRMAQVVFFASAAPIFMLRDPEESHGLRGAFDQAVHQPALSLYSRDDMVLALTFPVGQTFARGHEGFFPTALGHDLWESAPAQLQQVRNAGAGHSDYWGWKKQKPECEHLASTEAAKALGFTTRSRQMPVSYQVRRDTPEMIVAPVRVVGGRPIPARTA